jgi:hypothetical protein
MGYLAVDKTLWLDNACQLITSVLYQWIFKVKNKTGITVRK